jgi:hypothetical protein
VAARIALLVRAALEIDTLVGARGRLHPGLIAWGRKASP